MPPLFIRLYRGEIAHKGHFYPGEHRAIIDSALWDGVQAQLAGHRVDRSLKTSSVEPSLLAGIIYDGEGNRLTPTHSKKGNKRYRYYISHGLIVRRKGEQAGGLRIPAADLERAVVLAIRDLAGSPSELIAALGPLVGGVVEHHRFLGLGAQLYQDWSGLGLGRVYEIVRAVVGRVEAHSDSIRIDLQPAALAGILFGLEGRDQSAVGCGEPGPSYTITVPAKLQRAGQEMRLVVEAAQASSNVDPTLAKLIHQAVRFRDQFLAATREGISELAAREGISGSHYTRVLRLGFLAPDINAAIASGCQPVGLTATKMLGDTRLPLGWVEQRIALGFRPAR